MTVRENGAEVVARAKQPNKTIYGVAFAATLLATSAAQAQNCTTFPTNIGNLGNIVGTTSAVVGNVASAITTVNTAFLTQSSAFVGAPANPQPGQASGGAWIRGVGGEVTTKSSSTTGAVFTVPAVPAANTAGQVACNTSVHQTFAGVQVGRDWGKLDVNGWNLHFGTTAGYLSSHNKTNGSDFTSDVEVPFAGIYGAATYGRFFADVLVRGDYYQNSMNSPSVNIFNQNFSAHGLSIAGSAGYNYALPNNWFIEPSIGIIHSSVKVDAINTVGAPPVVGGVAPVSGTISINDINSTIGRIGARFGTTVNYGNWTLQPFASVSVWHDFSDDITANYAACCSLVFGGVNPATLTQSFSGQNIGTFGQYSVGVSGQLANTGWLAFVRLDYRNGSNLDGLSGTGGIRYQFTPDGPVAPIVTKGKSPLPPLQGPVNWAGSYIGGFLGANYGQAHWGIAGLGAVDPHVGGIVGGVEGGHNWQIGMWVYGIEGDWGATNLKGGQACSQLGLNTPFFDSTCNASADWVATLTGRVGITWDRALLFVKAGGAWTDANYTVTCNAGPLNGAPFPGIGGNDSCRNVAGALVNSLSVGKTTTGWVVGFGSEFALTQNWSAKAEYDYIDFGDRNFTAADGSLFNLGLRFSQVKVGVNYHFNAR
ncbi:MAG: autotransporter domain-containing protein [Xanthobacteraceae bacterium]